MRLFCCGWMLAAAALISTAAYAEDVALTFDDLPVFGRAGSTADAAAITLKLLAGLTRHHVPATGFVNEIKLEGNDRPARVALLRQWVAAGMDLGNHGYSHLSLTNTPVDSYIADVARGETVTRALLAEQGRSPHWFRHPYLETGPTPEIRIRFETWLTGHGYRIAPVSMENADWVFALPYDDAVMHHDRSKAQDIRRSYLDYTVRSIIWYRQAAFALLGHRPSFVFLLHASRLNADTMGSLSRIFSSQQLHPVTLATAMVDPAYTIRDDYTGPEGDTWLTRWALALKKELPWSTLPSPPPAIVAASIVLDTARPGSSTSSPCSPSC